MVPAVNLCELLIVRVGHKKKQYHIPYQMRSPLIHVPLTASAVLLKHIPYFHHSPVLNILTFKNRASYTQDGRTATLQMLHFIYFFNKCKY